MSALFSEISFIFKATRIHSFSKVFWSLAYEYFQILFVDKFTFPENSWHQKMIKWHYVKYSADLRRERKLTNLRILFILEDSQPDSNLENSFSKLSFIQQFSKSSFTAVCWQKFNLFINYTTAQWFVDIILGISSLVHQTTFISFCIQQSF